MGKISKWTLHKRIHINGQQASRKKCSTLLVNREMQIKTLRSKLKPPEWLKLKTDNIDVGEVLKQLDLSCIHDGNVK